MDNQNVDILIVGGGLTGASLLLALAPLQLNVLLIDNASFQHNIKPDFDARSLALAPATLAILESLDLWRSLKHNTTPIQSIHISQKGYLGSAVLAKQQANLGYVAEIQYLSQLFNGRLNPQQILAPASLVGIDPKASLATIEHNDKRITIKAKLIVAADGVNSTVRKRLNLPITTKEFKQFAINANIGLERAHHNIAYERFTKDGPLAMLPLNQQRASMVWSVPPERVNYYKDCSDNLFLTELQRHFGYRLGRFTKIGQRSIYPLKQSSMQETAAWPCVFIGNAANTLHPVAGQGFNLGLRDAVTLAQCISKHGINGEMLAHYSKARRYDHKTIQYLTHNLATLFTSSVPGMGLIRGLGLMAFDNNRLFKKLLSDHASGFGGLVPDLACGIPLK